jgi:hypothetical protein
MRDSVSNYRLLAMLATDVGVMDFGHAARLLDCSQRRVGRRLSHLLSNGAVTVHSTACRRLHCHAPLFVVMPESDTPDLDQLQYAALARWQSVRSHRLHFLVAGPVTRRLFGRRACLRRTNVAQLAHDLGLADARLFHLGHRWLPEPHLDITSKRPDACLLDSNDRPTRLIEHVSSYPKARIQAVIELARTLTLPLEIW